MAPWSDVTSVIFSWFFSMLWCNRVARFNNVCKSLLPKIHNSSIWKSIHFYMHLRWSLNLLAAWIVSNSSYTIRINSRAQHLWERTWRNRHPIYTHNGSEEQSKAEWGCRLATSKLCKQSVIVNHSSCSFNSSDYTYNEDDTLTYWALGPPVVHTY